MINDKIYELICCPNCEGDLIHDNGKLTCKACEQNYEFSDNYFNLLPQKSKDNDYDMDYILHYKNDAQVFDYFQHQECRATEQDDRRSREYILSKIKKSNSLIADIGSGSAWVASNLTNGNTIISFDISDLNVKKSLEIVNNENHIGIVGDALNAPFKEQVFDFIISSEVIEHIVKPEEFINRLSKHLKPGGLLLISTPYKEKIHYSQCIHCNKMTPKNAHLHSFDENILKRFALKGINLKEYYTFGNKALVMLRTHVILQFLPFTLWKLIDKIANMILPKPAHILVMYEKDNR